MDSVTTLSLILAVLMFSIGVLLFVRFFPWRIKETFLKMVIVLDVDNFNAFNAIMAILDKYDLVDANYAEDETTSRITIAIPKESYEPIFHSISVLPNVEVI